jgi:lysine 2,3-aminomutase
MLNYEALGRARKKEYEEAVTVMDRFIGRKGVFLPKIIIVDEQGNHLETTNRTKLPTFEKSKKAKLLNYELFDSEMPLTNPADAYDEIEAAFSRSKYASG